MTGKRIALIGIVCSLLLTASLAAWGVESGAFSTSMGLCDGSLKRLIIGHVGRVLVLKSQLDVTDEQKEKTVGIIKSRLDEIIPAVKNVVEKRRALRQAVMKEEPNEKEIRAAAEALGRSLGDASVLTSKIVAEARPVFTPRQVKLVEDFRISLDNATTDWLNQLGKK
jgi:Spy/CpxP family protein refolding chaperone